MAGPGACRLRGHQPGRLLRRRRRWLPAPPPSGPEDACPGGHTLALAQPSLSKPPQGTGASSEGAPPIASRGPRRRDGHPLAGQPGPTPMSQSPSRTPRPSRPRPRRTNHAGRHQAQQGACAQAAVPNPVVKLPASIRRAARATALGSRGGTPAPAPSSRRSRRPPRPIHGRPASASGSRPATSQGGGDPRRPRSPCRWSTGRPRPGVGLVAAPGVRGLTNGPMAVAGGPWPGASLKAATSCQFRSFRRRVACSCCCRRSSIGGTPSCPASARARSTTTPSGFQ